MSLGGTFALLTPVGLIKGVGRTLAVGHLMLVSSLAAADVWPELRMLAILCLLVAPVEGAAFNTLAALQDAVDLWTNNETRETAAATYGDINTWHVSLVQDMSSLFFNDNDENFNLGKATFNDDIDDWDTSSVTSLYRTFLVRRRLPPTCTSIRHAPASRLAAACLLSAPPPHASQNLSLIHI